MSTRALVLAIAGVIAAGCATPPPGRPVTMRPPAELAEPVPEFERLGEIQFTPAGTVGTSAAWDRRSVRGPAVNLTLTDEGLWGGTLRDRAVLLLARGGRITGEGVDLFVTQDGPVLHVQGVWFGSLVRVDLGSATLSASPAAGICGIELGLAPDGLWRGFGGCGGALESIWMNLKGLAADPSAEMPQWIFAFLATLPSAQVSTLAVRGTPVIDGAGLAWFLPAEFRGPAPWYGPIWPCSRYDTRQCGPLGYDRGTSKDLWFPGGAAPVSGQVSRAIRVATPGSRTAVSGGTVRVAAPAGRSRSGSGSGEPHVARAAQR
jgi:hypothetical protein